MKHQRCCCVAKFYCIAGLLQITFFEYELKNFMRYNCLSKNNEIEKSGGDCAFNIKPTPK